MSNALRRTQRHAVLLARKRRFKTKSARRELSGIIVYGASCVWWDIIENANGMTPVPTCPHCGSVLFQLDSEEQFWAGSETYQSSGRPGYIELLKWLKGKCFKSMADAAAVYQQETGIHLSRVGLE